jgi:hypothetical protein
VISSLHDDDVIPPGPHSRNLDCGLNGFATRVPKEKAVQLASSCRFKHGQEVLDKFYVWVGESNRALDVNYLLRLVNNSRGDYRMTVAKRSDADTLSEQRILARAI